MADDEKDTAEADDDGSEDKHPLTQATSPFEDDDGDGDEDDAWVPPVP